MTQDLSANTLEAVRKSMTVMSFMVILFYFAGGHIPEGGAVIKLPLSNVEFTKPERLLYLLWVMMVYRYFALGARDDYRKEFYGDELKESSYNGLSAYLIKKYSTDDIYVDSHIKYAAVGGRMVIQLYSDEGCDELMIINKENEDMVRNIDSQRNMITTIDNKLVVTCLMLIARITQPSTFTFSLPLVMISIAFILTFSNLL